MPALRKHAKAECPKSSAVVDAPEPVARQAARQRQPGVQERALALAAEVERRRAPDLRREAVLREGEGPVSPTLSRAAAALASLRQAATARASAGSPAWWRTPSA